MEIQPGHARHLHGHVADSNVSAMNPKRSRPFLASRTDSSSTTMGIKGVSCIRRAPRDDEPPSRRGIFQTGDGSSLHFLKAQGFEVRDPLPRAIRSPILAHLGDCPTRRRSDLGSKGEVLISVRRGRLPRLRHFAESAVVFGRARE
jgi:hypothetical protein